MREITTFHDRSEWGIGENLPRNRTTVPGKGNTMGTKNFGCTMLWGKGEDRSGKHRRRHGTNSAVGIIPRVLESPVAHLLLLSYNGMQLHWDFWTCLESRCLDPLECSLERLHGLGCTGLCQPSLSSPAQMENKGRHGGGRKHMVPASRQAGRADSLLPWPAFLQAGKTVECGRNSKGTFRTPKKHSNFFFLETIYKSILRTSTTSRMYGERYNKRLIVITSV